MYGVIVMSDYAICWKDTPARLQRQADDIRHQVEVERILAENTLTRREQQVILYLKKCERDKHIPSLLEISKRLNIRLDYLANKLKPRLRAKGLWI